MTQNLKSEVPQKLSRVFISHSSEDREFSDLVKTRLQSPDIAGWIDSEQITTGDDILTRMGDGLRTMDILVVLISQDALESSMMALEVNHGIWREVTEKQVIVLPFIIDYTPIDQIRDNTKFWHLAQRHLTRIDQDDTGTKIILETVQRTLEKRSSSLKSEIFEAGNWKLDPTIEELIAPVKAGDWDLAARVAVEILGQTDDAGNNRIFQSLVTALFRLGETDDRLWGAVQVLESLANLAPSMFDRSLLARMANDSNFTIRSSVASICMDFAQFTPERVPLDIAFRLSRYDEDWYVMAPAMAALKTLVRPIPHVLAFFYNALHEKSYQAREQAAGALLDISKKEPELLNPANLEAEIAFLWRSGDEWTAKTLTKVLFNVKQSGHEFESRYKYGL